MLLTRFWLLLLSVLAGAGIAVAVIATRLVDDRAEITARADLARDRLELEQVLKLDARTRIDAIAPIAGNDDIRSALREANGRAAGAETAEPVRSRLRIRLGELNAQLNEMAGDLVFAVDESGIIIAQLGGTAPPTSAGLGAFPLVQRALEGFVRDDVWVWNGELFRMAARPVIDNGRYIGAIVHGKRIDDVFANRIVTRLSGATVAFFLREQILASAMSDTPGAPRCEDIQGPLPNVIGTAVFTSGQVPDAAELPTGGFGLYAPLVGSASHGSAGYALARPATLLGSPFAVLEGASRDDWQAALPWMAGAMVGLFVLSMLLVYLERDRPLAAFRDAAIKLGKKELERFEVASFGGPFRVATAAINDALDDLRGQISPQRKKVADLDAILGEAPAAPAPSFFGLPESPAAPPPAAPPAAVAPPRPAPPAPKAPPPRPAPPSPPAAPPPAAPPVVPPPGRPAITTTAVGLGSPSLPPPALDDDFGTQEEEGATTVARVPDELIKQSATGQFAAVSPGQADEMHFKEVFKQFIATKQQCGEATDGVTYEKFRETLRKNQEKIQQTHGTAKVRFTVYVKDGKAALKATPVKG